MRRAALFVLAIPLSALAADDFFENQGAATFGFPLLCVPRADGLRWIEARQP